MWDPETQDRLARWTSHFMAQGADAFTAERRAVAMLYREMVSQAQVLAYADDFWLLAHAVLDRAALPAPDAARARGASRAARGRPRRGAPAPRAGGVSRAVGPAPPVDVEPRDEHNRALVANVHPPGWENPRRPAVTTWW